MNQDWEKKLKEAEQQRKEAERSLGEANQKYREYAGIINELRLQGWLLDVRDGWKTWLN